MMIRHATTSFVPNVDDAYDEDNALVSYEDIRRACGISDGSVLYNDSYVAGLERSASKHLSRKLGAQLRPGIVTDYFSAFVECFALSARQLEDRPVPSGSMSGLSVRYTDMDGNEQTLPDAMYTQDFTTTRPLLRFKEQPMTSLEHENPVTVSYTFDPRPGNDSDSIGRMMSLVCKGTFSNEAGELVEGGSGLFYFRQADRMIGQYRHLQAL